LSKDKAKKRKSSEPPRGIRAHKTLLAWLLGVATILGGIAVVLPRPAVIQSDPVDSSNPFSASFTITNSNIVPLRNVTAFLAIGEITFENGPVPTITGDEDFGSELFRPEWKNHSLDMDERFTITPADIFKCCDSNKVSSADIAISVMYQPWFLPWKREKKFRFVTKKQTNGLLYWYAAPLH
jgi:hypothetical protein